MLEQLYRKWLLRSARALALIAVAVGCSAVSTAGADTQTVYVNFVGEADSPAARGAALGLEEATLAARYFGFEFALLGAGAELSSFVIVATPDAGEIEGAAAPGRVVLNALSPKRGGCLEGLFHVAPSEAMLASAAAQWRSAREGDPPRVEAWHPSLVRFAARDLNKRYAAKYSEPMRSAAWGGWAAARSLGEAVLRTRTAAPAAVASYLADELGLDGQKGVALSFRPNRQLRQPLYYVDARDVVVGQAPLDDAAVDGGLDSLGDVECES